MNESPDLTGNEARGALDLYVPRHVRPYTACRHRQLGFDPNFSIYDDADQNALIKECLASLGKDAKEPAYYRTAIGRAKNRLLTPEEYAAQASGSSERQIAQVYRLYQRKLREQNAVDFDDLLLVDAAVVP